MSFDLGSLQFFKPSSCIPHWPEMGRRDFLWKSPYALLAGDQKQWSIKTLPKAQRAQGIEYFDLFNTFSSKQKLWHALKSWSNFSLVFFGKEQIWQIHETTLTNPCSNFEKSMYLFAKIHVTILTNPTNPAQFNKASDKARQWSDLGLIKIWI